MRKPIFAFLEGVVVSILVSSCFYDPPLKGKTLFIENQTSDVLYVVDSLTGNSNLKLYDTFSVNNRVYISRRPNYIPAYGKYGHILSQTSIDSEKKKNRNDLTFYFISSNNLNKSVKDISTNRLYDSIKINFKAIEENNLNYLFYFKKDNIQFEHEYNLKDMRN